MSPATNQIKESSLVELIADAVLYEGYILYPYRPSAVKNQQRWNFGVVCPESYAIAQRNTETSTMRTECLVEGDTLTRLDVRVRFLHLLARDVGEAVPDCELPSNECGHIETPLSHFRPMPAIKINGQLLQSWQEAVERAIVISDISLEDLRTSQKQVGFSFAGGRTEEVLNSVDSREIAGLIVRTQETVGGEIAISATEVGELTRLSIVIRNLTTFEQAQTKTRDEALLRSFVSTHTILNVRNGQFVSLLDPPEAYKVATSQCTNTGTFPVLVGEDGERRCMLSSPIILYDYPQIAPESPGALFDGTEIDEILTLRVMTLTDEEKAEMRSSDMLARRLLERTESMAAEQLMKLHGVMKKA